MQCGPFVQYIYYNGVLSSTRRAELVRGVARVKLHCRMPNHPKHLSVLCRLVARCFLFLQAQGPCNWDPSRYYLHWFIYMNKEHFMGF